MFNVLNYYYNNQYCIPCQYLNSIFLTFYFRLLNFYSFYAIFYPERWYYYEKGKHIN
nr:MAG TPA: hypothetical protein [Caudoviricetes sp.]